MYLNVCVYEEFAELAVGQKINLLHFQLKLRQNGLFYQYFGGFRGKNTLF